MQADLTQKYLAFHNTPQPMIAMDADYPDGASTGWHTHPRGQLLYAIEGVMVVQTEMGYWVVPPSHALWLTDGLAHEVKMSGMVKMRTVFIDAMTVGQLPVKSHVITVSHLLRELIVAAVHIPAGYQKNSRDDRLMRLLIDEIRISDVLPVHLPFPQDAYVQPICSAITEQPGDVTTANQWAQRLGVTTRTIHRQFVKTTGMTFGQWREQARLLHALRRLAHGERIIDIASDCGYASQSAFTAMFRRHLGKPPSLFYRQSETS
jgi:AraC-like DNA-binding protein